jgi:ABC-2 type transport system permease protein
VLWLVIFGEVFARARAIPTGGVEYLDFLAPGILAQSVLFAAIFYGISAIWERDVGVLTKFLASPAPRLVLVLGRALSSSVRGLAQAAMVYVLAILLGVRVARAPGSILGAALAVSLSAATFATLSLIVACIVKTRERFMGIGQIITMPLFFASNAIYPLSMMPAWLRAVAVANPLTYQVDALRTLMLPGMSSTFGLGVDFGAQLAALGVFSIVAARLYPEILT